MTDELKGRDRVEAIATQMGFLTSLLKAAHKVATADNHTMMLTVFMGGSQGSIGIELLRDDRAAVLDVLYKRYGVIMTELNLLGVTVKVDFPKLQERMPWSRA